MTELQTLALSYVEEMVSQLETSLVELASKIIQSPRAVHHEYDVYPLRDQVQRIEQWTKVIREDGQQ